MFLLALGFWLSAGSEPVAAAPPDGVDSLAELGTVVPLELAAEVVVLEVTAPDPVEVLVMGEVATVAIGHPEEVTDLPEPLRTPALLPDPLPDMNAGRWHPKRWCSTREGARLGWLYVPARAGPKRH